MPPPNQFQAAAGQPSWSDDRLIAEQFRQEPFTVLNKLTASAAQLRPVSKLVNAIGRIYLFAFFNEGQCALQVGETVAQLCRQETFQVSLKAFVSDRIANHVAGLVDISHVLSGPALRNAF